MAEGAAVLVLEERSRALARGAPIYAEVCGFGLTNDAYHMTAPRPDGRQAARAMRNALAEAHVAPHEVGYINAHGSSTPLNDPTETARSSRCSATTPTAWPSAAPRATTATPWARAAPSRRPSARSPAAAAWLPPTVNLELPDPACDLDHVTGDGRSSPPDYLLSNSFGFGGINAALLFRRAE